MQSSLNQQHSFINPVESVSAYPIRKAWFVKSSGGVRMRKLKAKKRYLVMDDYMIDYFSTDKCDEKSWQGSILINEIVDVSMQGKGINLATKDKKFHLVAQDQTVAKTWVKGIDLRMKEDKHSEKLVQKCAVIIKKHIENELKMKEWCEYIECLENGNQTLKNENARLKLEIQKYSGRKI